MQEKEQLNEQQDEQTLQKRKACPKRIFGKIKSISCSAIPWRAVGRWTLRFVRRRALPIGCFLLFLATVISLVAFAISLAVQDKTSDRIFTPDEFAVTSEKFDYILVLGCGVYDDGSMTPMLSDRVRVGVSLYQKGISDRILMSGDHQSDEYNEVDPMRNAAIAMGVMPESIVTDPYGISTYDSIARLAEVFEAKRVLIVTQRYHLPRALYIAERFGIEAVGAVADLRSYREQMLYDIREMFARFKDVVYAEIRPAAAAPSP